MFINKSTFALACVALANLVSAGQTPACLLSVVGHSQNPADMKTLCGSGSKDLVSKIGDKCGDNSEAALKFYASTCKAAGYTVSIDTSTASSSSGFITATATASGSASGTAGVVASSTATGTSGSGSTTGSGSSSSSSSSGASGTSSADPPVGTLNAAAGLKLQGSAVAAAVFVGFAALL
ncbi:Period circadian protein [Penicillium diatomitis]|uniref:Period circadian protein n=1 Tax=Penicillium diatomitis TaxID=2819901 RepID=A0A9X0BTV5_9EURO|nr:Period circadian protein [Penicillium diatomitis]KAJ5483881.1 Period circadian protein [Penicillium diatomitis]